MYPCKCGKIPPTDSRNMVDTNLSLRRPGSALKLICPPSPLVGGGGGGGGGGGHKNQALFSLKDKSKIFVWRFKG